MTDTIQLEKAIGRNEPCPCGSGKKYKRCCGVNAAPKLSEPKNPPGNSPMDPSLLNGFDPETLMQMTQAFQRLPKGQLQRMQALMQKAMNGKDITTEAQEFERTLPPDFQSLMRGLTGGLTSKMATETEMPTNLAVKEIEQPSMTEDRARELIAQAAAEGTISREQAEALLSPKSNRSGEKTSENPVEKGMQEPTPKMAEDLTNVASEPPSHSDTPSKFGKFWKNFSGKKNT